MESGPTPHAADRILDEAYTAATLAHRTWSGERGRSGAVPLLQVPAQNRPRRRHRGPPDYLRSRPALGLRSHGGHRAAYPMSSSLISGRSH